MSPRKVLHQLLDELPDGDLPTVTRVLEALRATVDDPLVHTLDNAPIDDEPDDDFDGGLSEARRAADEGRGMTTAQLRHGGRPAGHVGRRATRLAMARGPLRRSTVASR